MKKTILILLCLFFIIFSQESFAQIVTGRQKQSTKTQNVAKSPFKNARKGGRNTLPKGIKDKMLNFGVGFGIANPGIDLKVEEKATLGYTGHFYAHWLFKGNPTLGIGFFYNHYTMPVNNKNYASRFNYYDVLSTPAWSLNSFMASGLFNFTLQERISAQLIANTGLIVASIPKTTALYYDTLLVPSLGYVRKDYSYSNQSGTSLGWTAGFSFSFLYALHANIEAKAGFEWQYMRVKYSRDWILPEPKTEDILRQYRMLNVQFGIALSF